MSNKKSWFELSFQEKLIESHGMILFPDRRDKNKMEFLSMVIQHLIERVEGLTDDEINKLFENGIR